MYSPGIVRKERKFNMFVNHNKDIKEQYRYKKYTKKTNLLERSYFLTIMYFITKYAGQYDTVLITKITSPNWIVYLASLFPNLEFIVYYTYKQKLLTNKNIIYINKSFDIHEAEHYKNYEDLLFISTLKPKILKKTQLEIETQIINEHINQTIWINIINPKKSLIKFRPHRKLTNKPVKKDKFPGNWVKNKTYLWPTTSNEKYSYFPGDIIYYPYSCGYSTICLIIVDKCDNNIKTDKKLYYSNIHDNIIFNHNKNSNRLQYKIPGNPKLVKFGIMYEYTVLSLYLKTNDIDKINKITKQLNSLLLNFVKLS